MKRSRFTTEEEAILFVASHPGRSWSIVVEHDDGCTPSRCVCRPWYLVRALTPETLSDAVAKQAAWEKGTQS